MSSEGMDEVEPKELTQEVHEQRIVSRFDFYTTRGVLPPRGALSLRIAGFGVVTIGGIDPDAANVGDIVVKITHSGFFTRAEVWLKVSNGARGWVSVSQLQEQFFFTTYLA
jgi:hypothetical protein